MKAILFKEAGEPDKVLSIETIEKPVPGKGEICVKMLGSLIHPADLLFIRGRYRFQPSFPQVAGLEGAGIIESTGPGVQMKPGTQVSFLHLNTWAEFVIVPEAEALVLPDDFPLIKATQFVLNPFTAWGLIESAAVQKGGWLLVNAGNSAVAKLIIQIAKQKGVHTIALVRNDAFRAEGVALGARAVITSATGFEKEIMRLTDGSGVDAALDPVGGPVATAMLPCIAANGRMVLYAALSSEPFQAANSFFVYKNISITGFGIRSYLNSKTQEQKAAISRDLIKIISDPDFILDVNETVPIQKYELAIDQVLHGNGKKILLTF